MATKRVNKESLISETLIFHNQDDNEKEAISPSFSYGFIDVVSLDAIGGDPCIPTSGYYSVYIRTDERGGFKKIPGAHESRILATTTGGDILVDGVQTGLRFNAAPLEIKIIPVSVDCPAYQVYITQLSDQLDITPDAFLNAFEVVNGLSALRITQSTESIQPLINEMKNLQSVSKDIVNQLRLLNARFEEMAETDLSIEDIEDD